MQIKKRLLSFVLTVLGLTACFLAARRRPMLPAADAVAGEEGFGRKTTLTLWYTDEALTDFLNWAAVSYGDSSREVRVQPVLVSGLGFLEAVGEASARGESFPDLFITTHDNLEKAALAGLASEVEHPEDNLRGDSFSPAALSSVTWHGRPIAYPFYAETTALLYNRTYLEDEARLLALGEGEEPPEGELLEARVQGLLPDTVEELLSFAGSYNAPDQVEAVIRFDVNDLFTDYFFAGDALDVGGENGDDPTVVDVYSERSLVCMDLYQQLGQFFAIDPSAVSEESVLQDLLAGRIVYTISTTAAVRRIAEARAAGDCPYAFGAAPLSPLTDEISTRALSVTSCVVVNGFSEHGSEAGRFARFLTGEAAMELYPRAGKLPARYRADYGGDPEVAAMMRAYAADYEASEPMPKMLETSNYWIRLEMAFLDIWQGENVNQTMRRVAEQLQSQIMGHSVTVEEIPDPERIVLSAGLSEEGTD